MRLHRCEHSGLAQGTVRQTIRAVRWLDRGHTAAHGLVPFRACGSPLRITLPAIACHHKASWVNDPSGAHCWHVDVVLPAACPDHEQRAQRHRRAAARSLKTSRRTAQALCPPSRVILVRTALDNSAPTGGGQTAPPRQAVI